MLTDPPARGVDIERAFDDDARDDHRQPASDSTKVADEDGPQRGPYGVPGGSDTGLFRGPGDNPPLPVEEAGQAVQECGELVWTAPGRSAVGRR
jgi:hypothetical protein